MDGFAVVVGMKEVLWLCFRRGGRLRGMYGG